MAYFFVLSRKICSFISFSSNIICSKAVKFRQKEAFFLLTMNRQLPMILYCGMSQFRIFGSARQSLAMVHGPRNEVQKRLCHIATIENLDIEWRILVLNYDILNQSLLNQCPYLTFGIIEKFWIFPPSNCSRRSWSVTCTLQNVIFSRRQRFSFRLNPCIFWTNYK